MKDDKAEMRVKNVCFIQICNFTVKMPFEHFLGT